MEFPAILPTRTGVANRYAYAGKFERSDGATAATSILLKVDCTTGLTREYDLGVGCVFGEPVLVPRPQARAEDDAWALSRFEDVWKATEDAETFVTAQGTTAARCR